MAKEVGLLYHTSHLVSKPIERCHNGTATQNDVLRSPEHMLLAAAS